LEFPQAKHRKYENDARGSVVFELWFSGAPCEWDCATVRHPLHQRGRSRLHWLAFFFGALV